MSIQNRELNFLNRCSLFVVIIGVTLILTSTLVLIGWQYKLPALTSLLSSWTSMKINTAICFFLSGCALLLLNKQTKFSIYIIIAVISILILMISTTSIIEILLGADFGIDQFFKKVIFLNTEEEQQPARMALITAVNFVLISIAFLFNKQKSILINHLIAWSVFFLSLFSFYNFIYSANMQYVIAAHTTMAVHASILFMLLSLGILLIKPDNCIIELLMGKHIGSYYFRRILPLILLIPMIMAIIELKMEKIGLIEGNFGYSIIAAGTFLILGFVTSTLVIRMNRDENKLALAQTELVNNEKIFNKFTNNVDIIFYRISSDLNRILYISPAYEKIWGKSSESLYKNRQDWFTSIYPEDQKIIYEAFLEELQLNSSASAEYRIKRPDGSLRNIFDRAFQLKDEHDNSFCFMGIAIDITQVKLNQNYLQTQHDILRLMEQNITLTELAPQILKILCHVFDWDLGEIWLVDEDNSTLRCVNIWHKETLKMDNYEKESRKHSFKYGEGTPGQIWKEKIPIWLPDYSKRREFARSELAEKAELNCAFGTPIIFQDQVFGIIEFFSYKIQEPNKELLALMNTIGKLLGEFIQRTHTNEEIKTISQCDFLTGLLNRSTLEEELDYLISTIQSEPIAIIIVDIDKFKMVNEALGHDTGDVILKKIAERLQQLNNHELQKIARLGADKFILYLYKIKHIEDILDFAHQIERTIKDPFSIDNREFVLTATLGIALYPEDGNTSSTLITNANLAMTHAKKQGGNRSVFFTKELPAIALDKLTMYDDLRQAIIKKQFIINYQPQIDLKTGRICGAEALVRWQHPIKGLVPPNDFIQNAEETGLIVALNEHIMRMVFQQIKSDWQGPPISINISAQQCNDKYQLAEYLESLMEEFAVNAKHVELEITESMVLNNTQHNIAVLGALRQLGFKIAIDDFGIGFSSFCYLYRMPVDKVKIDRAFIQGLPDNQANFEIVKSMICMLHSLKKSVVAEGVESEAEVEFLKQEGCDMVQGYYYYKPMSTDDFLSLIAKLNDH